MARPVAVTVQASQPFSSRLTLAGTQGRASRPPTGDHEDHLAYPGLERRRLGRGHRRWARLGRGPGRALCWPTPRRAPNWPPRPPVPPSTSPSSSAGRISCRALAPAARALDWSGRYGPGRTRSAIGRDVVARALQRWRPGHDAVKQCRLTLPSGHANLVARLLNVFSFITP